MWFSRRIGLVLILLMLTFPRAVFSQQPNQQGGEPEYTFDVNQRDPFSPLISKNSLILIPLEMDIINMSLGGIIYSQGESVAIINNEIVKVGDLLGEYRVLAIGEKEVLLEKEGQGFTLTLKE